MKYSDNVGIIRALSGRASPSLARFVFFAPNSKLEIELTTVRVPVMRQNVRCSKQKTK